MRGSKSFPDCSVDEEVPTLGAVPNLFKASPATGELVGHARSDVGFERESGEDEGWRDQRKVDEVCQDQLEIVREEILIMGGSMW